MKKLILVTMMALGLGTGVASAANPSVVHNGPADASDLAAG